MYENDYISPYGAFEMKASYQKNLLIGNITAISLFLITAILLIASFDIQKPPVTIDTIEKENIYDFFNRLDQLDAKSLRQPGRRPETPNNYEGVIPIAVPDTEYVDEIDKEIENEFLNTNQTIGEGEFDDDSMFFGGNGLGIDTVEQVYPGETEFVPFEKEPEMYSYKEPEYPRLCKQAGMEGDVIMKVLVGKDGNVIKALVARSSGVEAFDDAALSVAKENKFTPALQNSIPIALWVTYTVTFRLQ